MWETAEEIAAGLRSGVAEEVAGALDGLEFQGEIGEPVVVPMPTADDLAPLGPDLPDDVASRFVRVLDRTEEFSPPVSRADRERELALAGARYRPTSLALEASLVLKQAADPGRAVGRALEAVAERGVPADEVPQATALVSYLLAGDDEVRAATVDTLRTWVGRPGLQPVVDGVTGELDDAEVARLAP